MYFKSDVLCLNVFVFLHGYTFVLVEVVGDVTLSLVAAPIRVAAESNMHSYVSCRNNTLGGVPEIEPHDIQRR